MMNMSTTGLKSCDINVSTHALISVFIKGVSTKKLLSHLVDFGC